MTLSYARLALGAACVLLATVARSDPVGEPDAPVVPPSASGVATGGYLEARQQHGVVRAVVVQEGAEEVSSRVWFERLEELPGEACASIGGRCSTPSATGRVGP